MIVKSVQTLEGAVRPGRQRDIDQPRAKRVVNVAMIDRGHLVERGIRIAKNAHPPRRRRADVSHPALHRTFGQPHQSFGDRGEALAIAVIDVFGLV